MNQFNTLYTLILYIPLYNPHQPFLYFLPLEQSRLEIVGTIVRSGGGTLIRDRDVGHWGACEHQAPVTPEHFPRVSPR